MSHRHYILALIILPISIIFNVPYIFHKVPIFKKFIEENELTLELVSTAISILSWVVILSYFYHKKWSLLLITGIIYALIGQSAGFFALFEALTGREAEVMLVGIIGLIYFGSQTVFYISFLAYKRINGLLFLKTFGIIGLLYIITFFSSLFYQSNGLSNLSGVIWLVQSVVFILHFVYERNKIPLSEDSVDVLDSIN